MHFPLTICFATIGICACVHSLLHMDLMGLSKSVTVKMKIRYSDLLRSTKPDRKEHVAKVEKCDTKFGVIMPLVAGEDLPSPEYSSKSLYPPHFKKVLTFFIKPNIDKKCVFMYSNDPEVKYSKNIAHASWFQNTRHLDEFRKDYINTVIDFSRSDVLPSVLLPLDSVKGYYSYELDIFTSESGRDLTQNFFGFKNKKGKTSNTSNRPQLILITGFSTNRDLFIIQDVYEMRGVQTFYPSSSSFQRFENNSIYSTTMFGASSDKLSSRIDELKTMFDVFVIYAFSSPRMACKNTGDKTDCLYSYVNYHKNEDRLMSIDYFIHVDVSRPYDTFMKQLIELVEWDLTKDFLEDVSSENVQVLCEYVYDASGSEVPDPYDDLEVEKVSNQILVDDANFYFTSLNDLTK